MFSNWFRSTPEPLPSINFARRNKILEGAAANIKLLYKFLHEHANIVKGDEHLRQGRLDAMFELLDDIKSRLEQTGFDQPQTANQEPKRRIEFRRCNTDLRRSTPIIIPSTNSASNTPPQSLVDKHPNPFSASSSSTPPKPSPLSATPPKSLLDRHPTPLSASSSTNPVKSGPTHINPSPTKERSRKPQHLMITPPLSPNPQKYMGTPPISPKPRRPPPLSVPTQSPLVQESNPDKSNPEKDVIVQENSLLKRKLAAANAARKSLENTCATIGRDNGNISQELARKTRELEEANETLEELTDINQRLYRKLSGEDVGGDFPAELVQKNKELTERMLKAAERYKTIMKRVKEAISSDGRIAAEMGSCVEMLSRLRHERMVMEERHEFAKMKKLLAKMEGFLVGWQGRLDDSPLKRID